MFSEFKLALKSMPAGTHVSEYRLDKQFFQNMESADIHDAALDVTLTINHKGDIYDMTFDIFGEIVVLCDRCLDEMQLPIDTVYHIVVKYGEEYCDESDDVLIIPEADNYMNVASLIYDTVSLEIPIMHTHPEGECNEAMNDILRQHSAVVSESEDNNDNEDNIAIDPRWNELKKLTDNN